MLQRFIQRAKELAKKNDKGGQWQQVVVGTHIEHVADRWEELADKMELGHPAPYYDGITWPELQSPYEEKLLQIPGIYACIPHGLIQVSLKESDGDDKSSL